MVNVNHDQISIRRQCGLLSIGRSNFYYTPVVPADESVIANEIYELWHEHAAYGYRKITVALQRIGYEINHKRVLRMMRDMKIQALYPKPKTSIANKEHKIYPYLLRNFEVTKPDEVWESDITYIKMSTGFMYLIAIIDVYSRYCVGWTFVNTMDGIHCTQMLEEALNLGRKPFILNTDQGSQFTSFSWTTLVESNDIKVSMDGVGRWADNIFIERFWRTMKHEHISIHDFETIKQARNSIGEFINKYNYKRLHQNLGYVTPAEVYGGSVILPSLRLK
jgi:putative transposase